MSGNDDEVCEYVYGRKALMKRLLTMLRSGSSGSSQETNGETSETTGVMLIGVLGLLLMFYMLFINRQRKSAENQDKKGSSLPHGPDDRNDHHGAPPPPDPDFNVD